LARLSEEHDRRNGKFGFGGLLFNFGTPVGRRAMWQRKQKAEKDPRILISYLPTWEVNPNESEEDLRAGFDEEVFLRDFAVEIPEAVEK
jgi:hypothetical protein